MVRTDAYRLRPVAGDSAAAQAVKVVARTHKTLIWERTRHAQRLRHQLRDYFPAALEAFGPGLAAADRSSCWPGHLTPCRQAADHRADQCRAQARPPPRHRRQDRRHPRCPAHRAADPAASGYRCLRRGRSGHSPRSSPRSTSRSRRWKGRWRHISASTRTLRSSPPSPAWDVPRRPGARRIRRRPGPVRHREGAEELRGHQPGHPPVRASTSSSWPGMCTTTGCSTPSTVKPFRPDPVSGARAYYDQLRARGQPRRCAAPASPTGWSGSCTAA